MKKRLRKKKHLGEFKQCGFEIQVVFVVELGRVAMWNWFYCFLDFLENNNACFGGSFGPLEWNGFVEPFGSVKSLTEADRLLVSNWLKQMPMFKDVVISPLKDAWYEDNDPLAIFKKTGRRIWKTGW